MAFAFFPDPPLPNAPPRRPVSALRDSSGETAVNSLPGEIAFLATFGVAAPILQQAAASARQTGTTADVALLAGGAVTEERFYRCLAAHLRLPFLDRPLPLVPISTRRQRSRRAWRL